MPPAYIALPARSLEQNPFLDAKRAQFPNAKNLTLMVDGLQFPDVPSAEVWMPNYAEAWQRGLDFTNRLRSTGGLDLDSEIGSYVYDLNTIFNK